MVLKTSIELVTDFDVLHNEQNKLFEMLLSYCGNLLSRMRFQQSNHEFAGTNANKKIILCWKMFVIYLFIVG